MTKFKIIAILLAWFLPILSWAALPQWQIVPTESSLSFTATQNNAPVSGQFKNFTGDISFDPTQLAASQATISVATDSVSSSYSELSDTLKTAAWFDTKLFPQATFKANTFKKTGANSYQAVGTLTIRDKTVPLTLNFDLTSYSPTQLTLNGSTTIKRSDFGVGQGEWVKTDVVKDEVQVKFVLSAIIKH